MKVVKVGNSDDDNMRSNTEYFLTPISEPKVGRHMWFESSGRTLYYTEPVVKYNKDYIRTKKCKYLLIA
jgi:hypothetical protein